MKFLVIFLLLISEIAVSQNHEVDELDPTKLISPNGRYYVKGGILPYVDEPCCVTSIIDADSGNAIFSSNFAGYIKDSSYDEVAWSEGSKYLAITGYESKRHNSINIYSVVEGRVYEVNVSHNFVADISSRFDSVQSVHRSTWYERIKWEKNILTFYIRGQIYSGNGVDGDNHYSYRVRLKVKQIDLGQPVLKFDGIILDIDYGFYRDFQ